MSGALHLANCRGVRENCEENLLLSPSQTHPLYCLVNVYTHGKCSLALIRETSPHSRYRLLTEIYNWAKCRKQVAGACLTPTGKSTMKSLHPSLKEYCGRRTGRFYKPGGHNTCCELVSLDMTGKLHSGNFKNMIT